uniref:Uncharacterized protein n=1 Tax=Schizaphis graminum TaxID=13262 RepID=A0A2S2P6M6_SCHGA
MSCTLYNIFIRSVLYSCSRINALNNIKLINNKINIVSLTHSHIISVSSGVGLLCSPTVMGVANTGAECYAYFFYNEQLLCNIHFDVVSITDLPMLFDFCKY